MLSKKGEFAWHTIFLNFALNLKKQTMNYNQFNKQQREVIEATGGFHLVLAPPGCGKTAVLAERVIWARQHGVAFEQMACLTFTNRASRSMLERIHDRMGAVESLDHLFVGNVHRFCSQFLFQNGVLPETTSVVDTDTSISIMADFLGEDELKVLGDARHRHRYSKILNLQHLMYQCYKGHSRELVAHRDAMESQALRELCVTFHLPYEQASVVQLYQHADFYREQPVLLSAEGHQLLIGLHVARQYEQYKQQNDLVDFEDLLLFTYDAMMADASSHIWRRFDWIQVDEVQDLNPLQLAIIDLFAAPGATVVCLGDAQQAIFSFMGAQTSTLQMLRERCGEHGFHNFYQNYRSPEYLLNVFNTYGQQQLGISSDLLPTTQDHTTKRPGDLMLVDSHTNVDEVNLVARMVRRLYQAYPEETTAVVVAFNSDADDVSAALNDVPHFKVSGIDLFTTPSMRLLLAHLDVLAMEQNFIAWSHIFTGLRIYTSNSASRQFVHELMQLAITPTDFLFYNDTTYVAQFVQSFDERDLVVFDTETTGLDVFHDDVVQLAAVRVSKGRVVGQLDLYIETSRDIPPMLGDVVNPLAEEYDRHPHLSPAQAFQQFADFACDCVILGHNATFDYQILEHNMQRYAPQLSMKQLWPTYFDSLKLSRLLLPRQKSYKLKWLVETLSLEGQNSHLASDDIMATLSLARHCLDLARPLVSRQMEFLSRHRTVTERFRNLYGDLFLHSFDQLFVEQAAPALVVELKYAYDYLRQLNRMEPQPKLQYVLNYIERDLLSPESGASLAQQLAMHMKDLSTMKESDLCGAASMTERVFVSTVHKAKGLEFDNVILFDAVVGKYPSAYASDGGNEEEARKFYVAMSRARRRLIITYCHNSVNRFGRWFASEVTPYMTCIRSFFVESDRK